MPQWVHDAIWWHVYPLGFVGAEQPAPAQGPGSEQEPVHRLAHLEAWLDHVVALGLNGLALGPVFASQSHGYDTVDYLRVDPRLGDDADLDSLLAACRERGIRVLFDGVFNHVGRGHPWVQEVLREGPGAEHASWFHAQWPEGGGEPTFGDFEGHDQLVALNHGEPAVADHITEVMTHWLDRGINGWRLDAAYAVPPAFWAQVLPRVRERHPQAYIVGEVIHGDYAAIVSESTMDSVTQYELWKAVWSSINDVNFHELAHALGRHDEFLTAFVPWTFVGNHDVTRIASAIADERHLAHAVAVLLTVGGTPAIYYGDELGYRGVKEERMGGDDQIRPVFPGSPADLSALGDDVRRLHQDLVAVRRRHAWLHAAQVATLQLSNSEYVYEARGGEGERLVVALNLGDAPLTAGVPAVSEVLAGGADIAGDSVTVPAHGWAVLS